MRGDPHVPLADGLTAQALTARKSKTSMPTNKSRLRIPEKIENDHHSIAIEKNNLSAVAVVLEF